MSLYRIQSTRAGATRVEKFEGRDHLVVPVVALQEGVVWPGNSEFPEFVPGSLLSVNPQGWNGKPVMIDHPSLSGEMVSANHPRVMERSRIGTIFNTLAKNNKLLMEAWLDLQKIESLGGDAAKMLTRIQKDEVVEVSVGVYTGMENLEGEWNKKKYKARWNSMTPDHLAILPEGTIGACSVAMGCGTRMLSSWKMDDDLLIVEAMRELYDDDQPRDDDGKWSDGGGGGGGNSKRGGGSKEPRRPNPDDNQNFKTKASFVTKAVMKESAKLSHETRSQVHKLKADFDRLKDRVQYASWGAGSVDADAAINDANKILGELRQLLPGSSKSLPDLRRPKRLSAKGDTVESSILVRAISALTGINDEKVEETILRLFGPGKMQDEDDDPDDDPEDDNDEGEDGEDPPTPEVKTNSQCKCQQHQEPTTMKTKDERISALIASKKNTFTDAHKGFLTTCSDEQLAKLEEVDAATPEPKAEEPKPVVDEPKPTVASAKPEEKKPITIEDLPAELRSLVDNAKAHDDAVRSAALKALAESKQTIYTETELKALSTKDLTRVATLATQPKAASVVDFSLQNLQGVTPKDDGDMVAPPSGLATLFQKK